MTFIKNNWFILLILILVIYLGYRYYMKIKADKRPVMGGVLPDNAVKPIGTTTVQVSNPTQPVNTPITSGYKVGDKMYAASSGVNIHDTPSVSSASVIEFYARDRYIGTFVGFQSVASVPNDEFVKIIVDKPYDSSLTGFLNVFGFQQTAVRFALSKQVYSK